MGRKLPIDISTFILNQIEYIKMSYSNYINFNLFNEEQSNKIFIIKENFN